MAALTTYSNALSRFYDPKLIPNCELWLDALDYDSFTLSGSSITQWNDKSGNNRHATGNLGTGTYYSGGASGINSLACVQITPTGNMACNVASGTFANGFSIFVVFQKTGALNPNETVLSRSLTNKAAPWDALTTTSVTARNVGNGTGWWNNNASGQTTFKTTTPTIWCASVSSSTPQSWLETINGTATTYTLSGVNGSPSYGDNATKIFIGTRADNIPKYTGNIGEIICYSRAITTAERQQIEGYLAWKWLASPVSSNILATHPFSRVPPYLKYFNPSEIIARTVLWIDSADSNATVSTGVGTPVTSLISKSDLPTTSTKTGTVTYGTRSQNGIPMINFAANANFSYSISFNSTTRCIFAVAYIPSSTTTNRFIVSGNTAGRSLQLVSFASVSGGNIEFDRSGLVLLQASSPNAGTFDVTALHSASNIVGNIFLRLNGSTHTITTNNTGANAFTTGVASCTVGGDPGGVNGTIDIGEVIIIDAALSSIESQYIEGYLAWKWGLQSSLPVTHPFYQTKLPPLSVSLNPLLISSTTCTGWYDASDASTITLTSGAVSTWANKVGTNNLTASGTGPTVSTYNGQPILSFSGSNYLKSALTIPHQTHTIAIAYVPTTQASATSVVRFQSTSTSYVGFPYYPGSGTNYGYYINSLGSNYTLAAIGGTNNTIMGAVTTQFNILVANVTSGSGAFRRFGTGAVTTVGNSSGITNGTSPTLVVGAYDNSGTFSQYFSGSLAEILIFNANVNRFNENKIVAYLSRKWAGATVNLNNATISQQYAFMNPV